MWKSCNINDIALYGVPNISHQTIYGTQETLVLSSFVGYMTASNGDKIYIVSTVQYRTVEKTLTDLVN